MPGITSLDVSYGSVQLSNKFKRVTGIDGHAADINKGVGSPVYLWQGMAEGAGVVDIRILHDDEDTPEDYVKIRKDLSHGAGKPVYIVFKTDKEASLDAIIGNFKILYANEEPRTFHV